MYTSTTEKQKDVELQGNKGDTFLAKVRNIDLNQKKHLDLIKGGDVLLGFCCDEGVRRNNGRTGAKEGPAAFRREFGKLYYHQHKENTFSTLYDAGNVICVGNTLEDAQEELSFYVREIISSGGIPVIIGGGHEVAYGHYLGLIKSGNAPAIVNFDAHFDLREFSVDNIPNSGTPFRQIEDVLSKSHAKFNYYCCGIQRFSNSVNLFSYAKQLNVEYQMATTINTKPNNMSFINKIIEKHQKVYLTICLDVFNASIAPGVSAPQALGITPEYVLEAVYRLKRSNRIAAIDIAELNPKKDSDSRTAKLAANIIAEYLYA